MSEGQIREIVKPNGKKWGIIGVVAVILIALIIGIGIYNTPANRLARLLNLGNRYLEEENYEQAAITFNKAIAIDDRCIEAYAGGIKSYQGIDDKEGLPDIFERALDVASEIEESELIESMEAVVEIYLAAGDVYNDETGRVVQVLENGLKITEDTRIKDRLIEECLNLTKDYTEKGDYGKALEIYDKLLELGVENDEVSDLAHCLKEYFALLAEQERYDEIETLVKKYQDKVEFTPVDEALEQYRIIISQADSYEYGEYVETDQPWKKEEFAGYWYALVQMQPDDPVPTLLLEKEMMNSNRISSYYARVFQYDPFTKTVHQPADTIRDGRIGGLSMAGDGYGILGFGLSGGINGGYVTRFTLDGDSLNQDTYWTGQLFKMPDDWPPSIEIEWHKSTDWSTMYGYVQPEARSKTQTENENTSPLADYAGTYTPYEIFHNWYGGGERLRDITLTESGMVTGGGTSWSSIKGTGLDPSEILQYEDGSIEIRPIPLRSLR